tara:strand:- start:2292 stop:3089 length:798 start_codon:yes stop_codon:yes gene_type:complete
MDKNYIKFILLFFQEKPILKHLIISFFFLFLLFSSWLVFLDYYTLNNKHVQVPDLTNVSVSKLDSIIHANDLQYIIIDSIFDRNRSRGVVINQIPAPLSFVKQNRRIYITINSLYSKKITFPDIRDFTLRQAVRKLKILDFEVGSLNYRPDIARNRVLDFSVNGINIYPGQELYVGTVIDLVLGKGLSKEQVLIPNLIGLNRMEANIILKSKSLNIGSQVFNLSYTDSSDAIIYKQYPIADDINMLNIGSSIDLFFQDIPKENNL